MHWLITVKRDFAWCATLLLDVGQIHWFYKLSIEWAPQLDDLLERKVLCKRVIGPKRSWEKISIKLVAGEWVGVMRMGAGWGSSETFPTHGIPHDSTANISPPRWEKRKVSENRKISSSRVSCYFFFVCAKRLKKFSAGRWKMEKHLRNGKFFRFRFFSHRPRSARDVIDANIIFPFGKVKRTRASPKFDVLNGFGMIVVAELCEKSHLPSDAHMWNVESEIRRR